VIILDGSLTLDIPNRIKLALNEANDKERYYAKLTNRLFVTFQTDKDKLKVVSFEIHELVNARKISDSVTVRKDIPDEYETYLGKYIIPQLGKSFTVKYKNANLIIRDDAKNIDTRLQPPDKNGWRFDEYNKNSVKFYFNDNGKVNYYTLDVITKFTKGQLATSLIEKIAETDGIKTAIKQLFKLNEEKSNNYTINETSINLLGYKYLKQGEHKEAIAVLKVNTELYPESANTYDSLAEAYMKTGDSDKAIINYNKSLELNPDNENAKKMLLKLKTGK
jgi:tetratricopeptide (TPR) repeat protein